MKDESLNLIRRLENRLKDVQIEIKEANAKILILEAKHGRTLQLEQENQELRAKGEKTKAILKSQEADPWRIYFNQLELCRVWGIK